MNYKFYKEVIENIVTLGILPNEIAHNVLFRFGDSGWTIQKIQEIIDEIEESREKEQGEDYKWQNEDVLLISNKHGVFFIDLLAQRAGKKPKKQDLDLEHDEFITFLQDFKKFIKDNS